MFNSLSYQRSRIVIIVANEFNLLVSLSLDESCLYYSVNSRPGKLMSCSVFGWLAYEEMS